VALPVIDLPVELAKLKAQGWIKSNRKNDTGIGKTIEDLLGIPENNLGKPDCVYRGVEVEIKAHRMRSNSMITLFTLEPGVRHLNDVELMRIYGYNDFKGRRALKVTLTTSAYIAQGLMLQVNPQKGTISIIDKLREEVWIQAPSSLECLARRRKSRPAAFGLSA